MSSVRSRRASRESRSFNFSKRRFLNKKAGAAQGLWLPRLLFHFIKRSGANGQDSGIGVRRRNQIGLVLSSRPGVYALERAQKAGIETVVVDRKSCATAEEFSARVLHQLQSRGVEMVVLAGFLSILCKDMVEAYPNRIINVHPSLIPSFCGKGFYGLKVHQAALDYGVKVTGATVHYVNEVTDGGSIILQKAVYIEPDDTPETLQRRVMEQAEWELLPKATAMVCQRIQEEKDRQ